MVELVCVCETEGAALAADVVAGVIVAPAAGVVAAVVGAGVVAVAGVVAGVIAAVGAGVVDVLAAAGLTEADVFGAAAGVGVAPIDSSRCAGFFAFLLFRGAFCFVTSGVAALVAAD